MSVLKETIYDTEETPYLLFTVGDNVYAINCEFVRNIETLNKTTHLVGAKSNVRGGVIYQNAFISLIDMRKLFGLDSQIEEFGKKFNPISE